MTQDQIDRMYAHVLPIFWPVLWWNVLRLSAWESDHSDAFAALSLRTTWYGVIYIEAIYPKANEPLQHLRVFEACSEAWTLDQLGHEQAVFARLKAVGAAACCVLCPLTDGEDAPVHAKLDPG